MTSITRRDFLKLGGAALLSSTLAPVMDALADEGTPPVFYRGSRDLPKVALTFDDCYFVTRLHQLEQILKDYPDFRITLFPVGDALIFNEEKDPGIWKRFIKSGHDIGYHSYSHDDPTRHTNEEILRDFDLWRNALQQVLGFNPAVHFARPPFGNTSPSFLNLCKERHLICTLWSWGWGGFNAADVIEYNLPKTKNGDIVLMHTRPVDMEVFGAGLGWLAKQNIQAVSLRRLYADYRREQIARVLPSR